MVETITPVVHGGRRGRWAPFLVLHVAGAVGAAALFGATLGEAGALLRAPWGAAGLAAVAAVAAAYLAREVAGLPVPVPQLRSQVPDWWRTFFPFGPASFLYGVGLGVGFLTYLSHGSLVVVSVAAVASGRPLAGAALLGSFGLARGLSAVVAMRSRTPEEGARLVARLAASASWGGWRLAHAIVLAGVAATAVVAAAGAPGPSKIGSAAAALLAVAFGGAGIAKLVDLRTWRRALGSYRLARPLERGASGAVPVLELGLAALPFLGLESTAGLVALAALGLFSLAIGVARVRVGRVLDCGCFGSSPVRDYRSLLARNAAFALVAAIAWRGGVDSPVGGSLGVPGGANLLPAGLVALGVGLSVWVGALAVVVVRRGARR
jgi:hypothetical protein